MIGLLIVFQFKHFLCDYPLQGKYMLGKFKGGTEWIVPLTAHASVHAVATWLIATWWGSNYAVGLALFDFAAHFVMDRIKASPTALGGYKSLSHTEYRFMEEFWDKESIEYQSAMESNRYFWWALGFDQMIHHLTHYFIIWYIYFVEFRYDIMCVN